MGYYYCPWILTASWPPSEHTGGVLSPSSRPPSSRKGGSGCELPTANWSGPPVARPICSRRSNSSTDIGCQQTFVRFPKGSSSVHWRHWSTPPFVILVGGPRCPASSNLRRADSGQRTAASVSAISAAMTVSTTWGTKICRPRGRQPGRWQQPFPVPRLPEAKLLLVPLLGRLSPA